MTTTPAPGVTPTDTERPGTVPAEVRNEIARILEALRRDNPRDKEDIITYAREVAALRAQPIPGTVGVQELEWRQPTGGPWAFIAEPFGAIYRVSQGFGDDTKWELRLFNELLGTYGSPDEAKAAAQAHYERLILSCLTQGSQP